MSYKIGNSFTNSSFCTPHFQIVLNINLKTLRKMLTTPLRTPKTGGKKIAHHVFQPGAKLQCVTEKYRDSTAVPRRNLRSMWASPLKVRRVLYRIPLPLPRTASFWVQHNIALTNNALAVSRKMRQCMPAGNCCYSVLLTNVRKLM